MTAGTGWYEYMAVAGILCLDKLEYQSSREFLGREKYYDDIVGWLIDAIRSGVIVCVCCGRYFFTAFFVPVRVLRYTNRQLRAEAGLCGIIGLVFLPVL